MMKIFNSEKRRLKRLKDIQTKEEIDQLKKTVRLEKNDVLAMFMAAISVFLPFVLLFFGILFFFSWLLFGRG